MFIDIDYNKRPKKSKLHLAKPNKQIISIISEKLDDNVSIKLGEINELTFSIPYKIDGVNNKHIELIKEKMLIKLSINEYKEWYVVEDISEKGESDSDMFNVTAYSLGYELKRKIIEEEIKLEAINARDSLSTVLEGSIWKIGYIDPIFEVMFRTLTLTNNKLDAIFSIAETYGCLLDWNTETREISLLDFKKNGRFRGMTIDYGRLLNTIDKKRTPEEMVTRLYVYGNEGLTIHSENPTGMGYIEDFSFFMYPFERDSNGNVIQSSHYMSNELCHAILNHQDAVKQASPQIIELQNQKATQMNDLVMLETQLEQLNLEMDNILSLLDIAKATGDTLLIEQRKQERDAKKVEIDYVLLTVGDLKKDIGNINNQIIVLQNSISEEASFTPELLEELNPYILESVWYDDRYTDVKELYQDGIKKFNELKQPKVTIEIDIDNLFNIVEEQFYWDKLILGDLIRVKYPQMNIQYMAKIIAINYNFGNGEISLTVANHSDMLDEQEKLVQLLYESKSATSLIENNKYKWDKINAVESDVISILTQEWDANKRKITAGVNNAITISKRGIEIRNPDFPNEVIVIQSGIVSLSKDGGETWKTAMTSDGVVAERLIGQILVGQELLITNNAGTFTFDANGVIIDANSFIVRSGTGQQTVNLKDVWNGTTDFVDAFVDDNIITAYEKKILKEQWVKTKSLYDSMIIRLNNYFQDSGDNNPDVRMFHQKYLDLHNYLFTDIQTDNYTLLSDENITKSTRIDRVVFDSRFKEYDNYRLKVDEILSLRAEELSRQAKSTADEAKANIAEVQNDIVYKIELISSKGSIFKNGIIETVLSAKVYRGKEDITATVPLSGFIWKKYDKNGILDNEWTNAHVGVGSSISITSEDVKERSVFTCDIDII